MKRLTLIRHANAEWKDASVQDFARPLSKRGLTEAEALGKLLLEANLVPDLLLASSAHRTQQTAEILARKLALPARQVKAVESLYLARPDDILTLVRGTGPRVSHVAIVGHNPGLSELARSLAPKDAEIRELATAACCTLTFVKNAWTGIGPPAARAVQFDPPARPFTLFS